MKKKETLQSLLLIHKTTIKNMTLNFEAIRKEILEQLHSVKQIQILYEGLFSDIQIMSNLNSKKKAD